MSRWHLFREAITASKYAALIFTMAAAVLALNISGNVDRYIVRFLFELPFFLFPALIGLLIINLIASTVGTVLFGSRWIAGLVAVVLAWAVAAPPSFGFNSLLRPAYALAIGIPWLFRIYAASPLAKPEA